MAHALEEGTMMMLLLAMALPQEFQEAFENLLEIVGKGDNMPIAGLIPIIAFFTWLALREGFRHDRLIAQGPEDEILDEMYKERGEGRATSAPRRNRTAHRG